MSVKLYDSDLGEALYLYLTGKLEKLPSVYRDVMVNDKKRLASAILYVQKRYGLSPQQVMEKIRERKSMGVTTITGSTLKKLVNVLDTLERNFDVEYPEVDLRGDGIRVVGLSDDRVIAVASDIPAGEGYIAPKNEKTAYVRTERLHDVSGKMADVEKLFVRDNTVYAIVDGEESVVGEVDQENYHKINIDSLDKKLETSDKHVELHVKPEVFMVLRKFKEATPDLYIVKENGKPAVYFVDPDILLFRVPDNAIVSVDIDPSIPDYTYARYSAEYIKNRWPLPSEKAVLRTKLVPNELYPLKISTKLADGLKYSIYYASGTPEKVINLRQYQPRATYQIRDDAVPYILADLDAKNRDVFVMPQKDKIIFIGSYSEKHVDETPYVVEIDAPSSFKEEDFKMPEALTVVRKIMYTYNDLIPQTFKLTKELGGTPQIGLNILNLSLFGSTYGLQITPEEKINLLKDRLAWYHNLNPSNSTIIELSGADLVDMINSLNSLGKSETHMGSEKLRLNVKTNGEAVLEAVTITNDGEKTVWKKALKATNPPSEELSSGNWLRDLFEFNGFPIFEYNSRGVRYRSRIPVNLLRKARVELLIPKEKIITEVKQPVIMKMTLGDATIYSRLF
jgi:hypothetical protein